MPTTDHPSEESQTDGAGPPSRRTPLSQSSGENDGPRLGGMFSAETVEEAFGKSFRAMVIDAGKGGNLPPFPSRPPTQAAAEPESPAAPHNEEMSMTREELMAHLDAQQARTEAMIARQSADTDRHLTKFEARIDTALEQMKLDRQEVKGEMKSTRTTMVVTAIASVIAIVGGIAAFNATVLSNMVASFESGKNTIQSAGEVTKRLDALQRRIETQASAPTAPVTTPAK